ncbi:MAG: ribosome recycling factor [Candidatus Harrisonbacteria bacterium CG10_big_fil_rev_8_21_14_0_10_40_38]|uniref:Ribosome recycling factor n=1 Tax=Candidatus Harrisonbacteria bacterium CG10_big_fil_rev_8_21_14_0_10_40_38 TaxID=1974583 RepID=A0A2H0US11_9BACT|nr:MAG: ribosome recycling factor [Candidatus Harrisonbacteria bacterium CG10_big_fil_rev_8_21_14_0_10_40_38]
MDDVVKKFEQETKSVIDDWKLELSGIRTNRPSPQLIEDIVVDYAGVPMKIKQLGSISVSPPRDLQISVWDKTMVSAVSNAIENSPLGLMPSVDGNMIRISMPPLTSERRTELGKFVKSTAEKVRIHLRMIRDDANKNIASQESEKVITEDQKFSLKNKVQELITKSNEEIDSLLEKKISEINES